jgi:hypothetical protein
VAGRATLIRLTGRGLELQRRMAKAFTSVVNAEVVRQFPEQEATILRALLGRFYQPCQAV